MKKLISLMLVFFVLFSLVGCSGTNASYKAVNVGKQALSAVDDYLDGTMPYEKARDKLEELHDALDYVDEMEYGEEHKAADFSVRSAISIISADLLDDKIDKSSKSYDELVASRNKLAKAVGEKKR